MLRGGCEHRGLPELAALQVPKKRHEKRYRRRETGGTCRAATRDRAGGGGGDGRCAYCEKKEMYRFSPFRPDFESAPTPKKKLRNSSSRYLRIYTVVMMFSQRTGNQALRKSNLLIKHKKCATNTLSQDVFGSF
jgi:hypothetical protein